MDTTVVLQSLANGLMSASIYTLVAIGLTLVLSIAGIVQLAHGEIYMLGAYGVYFLSVTLGLNFFLALPISALLVGVLGIGIERVFFRPFRHGEFASVVIIAMGILLLLQTIVLVTFGSVDRAIKSPIPGTIAIGGVIFSWERLLVILVAIVFMVALYLFIQKTRMGQAMLAVSQDLDAAVLLGISADRVSSLAMFLGSFLAAVGGALVGVTLSIDPLMGGFALMKGIAVIILGGMGSIPGAIIGGLILGLIDGMVPLFLSTHMASIIGFGLIILILLVRPTGLMGSELRHD